MESVDLQLNLDPRGYVQGASQAAAATAQLVSGQAQIQQGATGVERALRVMTPKALTASFVGFTAVAASTEQRLAGMQATASVTGQNMGRLTKTMNELARSFPVGNRGAQQIVQGLQQAGFSAIGQEKKIAGLASAVTKLGAATGEEASSIGRNLVTLNRAFGNTEMDPGRFSKMSDSLTTLSAKSGASASAILDFSKNIAPLARSAGIGQTNVMGISTAFAKLGEDGFAASNTMNKVLSDLNRSLRDGTPELNTYANIVGKTREEFESLAKTNMPEAVNQVFESIGAAGPGQGQRMLEDIGVEGVRGQRAIQAVTQAGGLRQFQNDARGAYGDGSTAKAADAAMDGLTDSLEKLGASSEQIAAAFGTPLLGAVTKFTDQLASATGLIAKMVSSGPIQTIMKALGGIGGALGTIAGIAAVGFAARRLAGTGALLAAPIRSAPVQAMRAAAAQARGRELNPTQQRLLDRVARDMDPQRMRQMRDLERQARAGTLDQAGRDRLRAMQAEGVQGGVRGLAARFANVGNAYGEQRAANAAARPNNVGGAGAGLFRGAVAYGTSLTRGWNRLQTDFINQAQQEVGTRRSNSRFGADDQGRGGDMRNERTGWGGKLADSMRDAAKGAGSMADRAKNAGVALKAAHKEIVGTQGAMRMLSNAAASTAKSMTASAALIGKAGAAAAMGIGGKVAGSALGMVGGVAGAAMIAGFMGYSSYQGNKQAQKERLAGDGEASITGTRDRYLEALGKAGDATMSFAAQAAQAATALAREQGGSTMTVDAAEREAARSGKVVQGYAGSAATVAEQINAQYGGRISSEEISAITTDLLRSGQNDGEGFSESTVNDILGMIKQGGQTGPYANTGGRGVDYNTLLAQAGESQEGTSIKQNFWRSISGGEGGTGGGWKDTVGSMFRGGAGGKGLFGTGLFKDQLEVGGSMNGIATTKEQEAAISATRQGIAENEKRQAQDYGADYARQESYKEINAAMEAAMATGNKDLVARLSEQLSAQAGAKGQVVSMDEIKEAGGFIEALAGQDKGFKKQWDDMQARGISVDGQGLNASVQDSPMTTLLDGVNLFGEAVSNRAADIDKDVNKALMAFREMPGDLARFQKALDAVVTEGMSGEGGMAGGMRGAIETMNKIGDPNNPIFKVAEASLREFERLQQANVPFQSTGTSIANNLQGGLDKARNAMADPTNPASAGLIREGRDQAVNARNQAAEVMKQRIMAEIQFQTSMARSQQDYNLQREYAEEDFERSMARTREDYGIQRARQIANFNRQVARATEDFHRGQRRAQRDFNIQMQRMNEDAAKSMYDPYKRIQVQAIYDLGTLMTNLREQNRAMQDQARNLEQLRGLGLNNNTIDQLGLNKSENAQQAARLVADLQTGGADAVEALNNSIAERMAAGATLFQDQSNKDLQRQREDFNRGLADQAEDFNRSMMRQREDFNRGMSEMASDFNRSMERAASDQDRAMSRMADSFKRSMDRAREDHKRAQQEIVGDYQTLQKAMQDAIGGNIKTGTGLMKDTASTAASEVDKVLKNLDPDLRKLFLQDGVIQLIVNKTEATNKAGTRTYTGEQEQRRGDGAGIGWDPSEAVHDIKGQPPQVDWMMDKIRDGLGYAVPLNSGIRPGAITATGRPSYHGQGRAVDLPARWEIFNWIKANYPNSKELIFSPAGKQQIHNGKPHYYTGVTRDNHFDHVHWAMAKGGIATRPIQVVAGEAGSAEAVIPLNAGGVEVLAKALQRYMSMSRIDGMSTGRARTHMVYQTTITNNDMRTEVSGPIQVVSNDPLDMARQLQSKARRDNLGMTPTRR